MPAKRYTVVIANRSNGALRRLTINLRPVLMMVVGLTVLPPLLIGVSLKWSARAQIDQLRAANDVLQVENGSYRAATGELTTQPVHHLIRPPRTPFKDFPRS